MAANADVYKVTVTYASGPVVQTMYLMLVPDDRNIVGLRRQISLRLHPGHTLENVWWLDNETNAVLLDLQQDYDTLQALSRRLTRPEDEPFRLTATTELAKARPMPIPPTHRPTQPRRIAAVVADENLGPRLVPVQPRAQAGLHD